MPDLEERPGAMLVDPHGRKINYLRLSVTGRCDLRCRYCRPKGNGAEPTGPEILSDEELVLIATTSVRLGIEKIRITGGGDLRRVLEGIERARECGFPQIKINAVVMRGINEDEIEEFAALTLDRPLRVRFIEYMPAASADCARGITVPGDEILDRLSRRYRLLPMAKEELGGPARYFRIDGGAGAVGVITPVSCHFCGDCNRIRVTSNGVAKGCLFSREDVDLKPFLRRADPAGLRNALLDVVRCKPDRHPLCPEGLGGVPVAMSAVGG
jgi:cyclic pyranopterin phosphate synthase